MFDALDPFARVCKWLSWRIMAAEDSASGLVRPCRSSTKRGSTGSICSSRGAADIPALRCKHPIPMAANTAHVMPMRSVSPTRVG